MTFSRGGWQEGRGGGMAKRPFFVEGEALALDSGGEWWIEPGTGSLHLWPNASNGAPPSLLVLPILAQLLAKYGIDISTQQQQIIAMLGAYMTPDSKGVTQ
jgi:hypothetical protein